MTDSSTESKPSPNPPSLAPMFMPDQIAKMQRVDNLANTLILPVGKVSAGWTGHILDRDDGKWLEWSYSMDLELSMLQLWDNVFDAPAEPHPTYEPCTCHVWTNKGGLTSASSSLQRTSQWFVSMVVMASRKTNNAFTSDKSSAAMQSRTWSRAERVSENLCWSAMRGKSAWSAKCWKIRKNLKNAWKEWIRRKETLPD